MLAPPAPGALVRRRTRRATTGRSRGDLAHGVERRLGASPERGQRAGELGWRVAILLRMLEPDDQRYDLVLDAVVQVSLQAPAFVVASEVGAGSRGPRRGRLNVARGGYPRSQLAALRAELFDLAGEFPVSGRERAASTAQRRQRLDQTVAGCPLGSPDAADLVTPLTRLNDCCGMCIRENGPAVCRIARRSRVWPAFPVRLGMCGFPRLLGFIDREIIPLTAAGVISFG